MSRDYIRTVASVCYDGAPDFLAIEHCERVEIRPTDPAAYKEVNDIRVRIVKERGQRSKANV